MRTLARLVLVLLLALAGVAWCLRPALAATAGPVRAVNEPPAACGAFYVVRRGDTPSSIAARCGVPVRGLLAANRLSLWSRIYPGQRLAIVPAPPAQAACPSPYVVQRGDTLAAIAARCGTSASTLMAQNRLSRTTIYPGQRLVTRPAPTPTPRTQPVRLPARPSPTPWIEPPIPP